MNPRARGTCALLIEGGEAHGGERAAIVAALDRRDVAVRRCTDRFEAIAWAVLAEEERGAGGARGGPIVVILTPAQAQSFGPALHAALLRTAPHSGLWVHDPAAVPPLAAYRAPEPPDARAKAVIVREAVRQVRVHPRTEPGGGSPSPAKPQLRLSGDGPPLSPAAGNPSDEAAPERTVDADAAPASASLLSDEELAMLLSDGWDRGQAGSEGGGA